MKHIVKENQYTLCLSPIKEWKEIKLEGLLLYYSGQKNTLNEIIELLKEYKSNWSGVLEKKLKKVRGNYVAILINDDCGLWAVTDIIRSRPIFYAFKNNIIFIGDDANQIKENCELDNLNQNAVLESSMSGYCSGNTTLYAGLNQLLSGSILNYSLVNSEVTVNRYYMYLPEHYYSSSEEENLKNLSSTIDEVFDRTIKSLNGRTAVIPLSGGLDSRLVLAKLVEKGYKNIVTFSYGLNGNPECHKAKDFAKKIGVPWHYIKITRRSAKKFYSSSIYKKYSDYSDGLSCVPNNQDVQPILILLKKNIIDKNAVVVNGQSGDFITGGHISDDLSTTSFSEDRVLNRIIEKHYSLWKNLSVPENIHTIKENIKKSITSYLYEISNNVCINDAAIYESWEYEERQTKYVVNGQRTYEYYGLDWLLPLWDIKIVELYRNMPYEYKKKQMLYKKYLMEWNYENIFQTTEQKMPSYNANYSFIVAPIIIAIKYFVGNKRRAFFVRCLEYTGRFGYLYSAYSFKEYIRYLKFTRNPVSLFVKSWLSDKKVFFELNKKK